MQRREFLKVVGAGAGVVGLGGVVAKAQEATPEPTMTDTHNMDMTTVDMGSVDAMDAHHQAGIETYLAQIGGEPNYWRAPLEYELDGDVKVFHLTCQEIDWEPIPGMVVPAMAYNGMVPGPEIRVTEGDRIRVLCTNEMPSQSTAIHWHGVFVPNAMDGVPFITQPLIKPGETFTYEFTVRVGNAGSHMYHSHHNAAEQVTRGLMGAFVIEAADKTNEPVVTADYTMILNDSAMGYTLNGRSFPHTQPISVTLGDKIRVRYMNEGLMIHPMHLHGMPQLVYAKDGWKLPVPYLCDTVNIAPGERYDVIIDCTEPGIWAYHCHILTHAESRDGMLGMVTVLIVNQA